MSLFEHYPAPAGSVHAQADAIQATGPQVSAVAANVTSQQSKACTAVSGMLLPTITASTKPVTTSATSVEQSAVFVAACVRSWGDSITTYNTGIDALNREYDAAVANNFGHHAPSLLGAILDGDLVQYAKDQSTFNSAVSTAKAALIADLTARQVKLEDTLDEDAHKAAGLLDKGPTDAALIALMQAGVLPFSAISLFPNVDFSAVDMKALVAKLAALGRSDWLMQAGNSSKELKALLDLMREDDVDPTAYKDVLQQYWLVKACEEAGIDLSAWDPSLGSDAMLPFMLASYAHYAKLFLEHPELQWAGMAGMIGPTFAGGMFDMQMLRNLADIASGPLDEIPGWLINPLIPSQLKLITTLGQMSEDEFAYFETSILDMQKQIFTDQMPMHEAYLDSGMDGIQEMYDAGLIDNDMMNAWQDIDSGDPDRIATGNEALLYREQHAVIGDDYDDMRNHDGPVGEAMTYVMGAIGSPGIPGAQTLAQYDPLTFGGSVDADVPLLPDPHGSVEVVTPLPAGNISNADTRWDLIEHDTLPAFQALVRDHPDEVAQILNEDVQGRIDDARIVNNIGDLIDRLSDFDINVDVGVG